MQDSLSSIASMRGDTPVEVAPGVAGLTTVMVNLYFVGTADQWVLVDAGLPRSANRIKKAAQSRFGQAAKPAAIVLTHGHFDHVGSLEDLLQSWDVPVYAHPLELPYLTGKSAYAPPDPSVGGGLMALLSPLFPDSSIDLGSRVRALPADGSLPELSAWEVIHTPGHTAGHISLFREHDRVLISGDALITTQQESALAILTQRKQLSRPPAYFTSDWYAAHRSVQRLTDLHPAVIASGHGVPLSGETMQQELEIFAENFYQQSVPDHGRYVLEPARADEQGILYIPPPVDNPTFKWLAALGVAILVGVLVINAVNKREKQA